MNLGITTIFDLRSETEMIKYNTPLPPLKHCEGKISLLRTPVFDQKDYSPEMMARYVLHSASRRVL